MVTPDGCVAALVAVTVRGEAACAEALIGTAGLLGAAMDHAGRLAGHLVMGPVPLAEEGVVIGEPLGRRLRLLTMLLQVSEGLKMSLAAPAEDTLGAAAVLKPSAMGLEAWPGRSASTAACAGRDTEAAAVVLGLTSLLFWADREVGREPLSSTGDKAPKAGGVHGGPWLTPPPLPLPPQLGLLFLQGVRIRLGSCALEVRSIKAARALEPAGEETLLVEALSLEAGTDLRSSCNRF